MSVISTLARDEEEEATSARHPRNLSAGLSGLWYVEEEEEEEEEEEVQ